MKNKKLLQLYILISLGIIILVNILSAKFFFRLDFTEDNRYTLSQATKDVLENLEQPVTIKAYFSGELPPEIAQSKQEFEELLIEYSNLSSGQVVYEFIDPTGNEELEKEAQQSGIPPLQVQMRKEDKFEATVCYLGASIQCGDMQPEVIPQIVSGMPIEFNLTSAIKKLSVTQKPAIAFLQGHGEASLSSMNQAKAQLDVLYSVEPVTLNDTSDQLQNYKNLAIIAPTDSFPASHLQQLNKFLAQGKSIFIAFNRVSGDLQNATGNSTNTGLDRWLQEKGINVGNDFVVDANCGQVGVVRQMGGYNMQQQIPFPYIPIIKNFNTNHPVSKGVEAAIFQFASSLDYSGDSTVTFTPLAVSSERAGTLSAPLYFNVEKQWSESDFPLKNIAIAGAFEGKLSGNAHSKLVVFTNGGFAVNGDSRNGQQLNPDNVNLLVNSIDWLSDDTGLIDLRTKGIMSRPIEELESGTRTLIKWVNFLIPILLILIIGFIRWQYQNKKRILRMQPGYIK